MYRLCLTSALLLALGTGASLAEGTSTPAADPIETIDSAAPADLGSSSTADSSANPNAEPSPAVENGAQPARETKRSKRRHATAAPTKTPEIESTETVEVDKTVEIKDTGERTVCEEIGLPGSRMVVGKRCHTYNIYDRADMKQAEEKKEQTNRTLADLRRMEDNLEREQRQREWDRERAVAAMVGGAH